MTQTILVAGAGIAGLNAAMALGGAGRQVVVLDRDPSPPDTSPEEAFYDWERKGATQLRHSHVFLGRLVKLIRERHPRLWSELLAAGAREFTFEDGLSPAMKAKYRYQPGDEDLSMLFSRRTTLELIMRRYAAELPGVTFVPNAGIRGVLSELRSGQVVVTGLRVDVDGSEQEMHADIVVDATGRTTQFPEWLGALGAALPEEPTPAGILYFSRHYRLRPGMEEPPRDGAPAGGDLDYIKYGIFPADNRHFSVTIACPEIESELRTAIVRPEIFDAACAMMPGCARWTDPERCEPVSRVFAMGNLKNAWRTFVHDGKPAALNFFPIGDAAIRTNPLYGRGCSSGAIQAHILADVLATVSDPAERLREHSARVTTEIKPFFDMMAQQDAQAIKRAGNQLKPGYRPSLRARFVRSFLEDGIGPTTRSDVRVLRAIMRGFHMLENPTAWTRKPAIMGRILAMWATPKFLKKSLYLPTLGPKRPEGMRKLGLKAA
jgi:2-polyprenyl-6-methoxyphenol hydroxylase-like FAD-dependent oxidoreductase